MKNTQSKIALVQRIVFLYAIAFFALVFGGLLPGAVDENGLMLGIFAIDPIDNALHLGSGIWAAMAAQTSVSAALIYLKVFGALYFLDGLCGMFFGTTFLDLSLFKAEAIKIAEFMVRFLANVPHVLIGLSAVLIGVYFSKKPR